MVIKHWQPDVAVNVDEIQQQLYSKEAGGIYASDMERYFEARRYRVFAFRGEWADLAHHIEKGRPLIVSLEQNSRGVPLHYVVVAGIDASQGHVLVNDPAQRKLLSMARADFERSWRGAGNWTLLALPELQLAGQAFRENNLAETREHLTAALRSDPSDKYVNDFLATVYFLEDNAEAALEHWNRAGKPEIQNIRFDPPLRTDPVLLDRAFAFSRGSLLRLSDYEQTEARLNALRVFSRYRMELSPADGEHFDLTFRAAERQGSSLLSWARGLPFQTVQPQVANIRGKAVNLDAMLRWDSNKQRVFAQLESPLKGNPKWGVEANLDGRRENWANPAGDFTLRKIEASAEIRSIPSGRWQWTSGAAVSTRHFSDQSAGGVELKYSGSVTRTLFRSADHGLRVDASLRIEAGKLFAKPGHSSLRFVKVVNAASLRWRSFTSQVRLGKAVGQVPFDERFMIGVDRDSDLWLRAHSATVDGRKNATNATQAFVLTNSDFQKSFWNTGWMSASAGPFLDTSKSSISSRWLVDTGLELRFSVLGSFGISVSYGKSLTDHGRGLFVR